MRPPQPKLAAATLRRCTHSTSIAAPPARPRPAQRYFHQSPSSQLPRRRNFFTSNAALQQQQQPGEDGASNNADGTTGGVSQGGILDSVKAGEGKRQPAAARGSTAPPQPAGAGANAAKSRKPMKNSLRRVALEAQKGVPAAPAAKRSPAPADDGSSTMSAVCVAESFDMDRVVDILHAHGFLLDPEGTGFEPHEVVHARGRGVVPGEGGGGGSGDMFVFPSGTVVTWGLPADVVLGLATRTLLPAAVEPHVGRLEQEDMEFVVDGERDTSTVRRDDVVVLGTGGGNSRLDATLAKIAFSSGLARSTKLAVLEAGLEHYLEATRHIPALLATKRRLPLGRRFVLRQTGELLGLRARLNHYNELTDSLPDMLWDSRSELGLETYYDRLGRALDVQLRIGTLNEKMNYAQDIAAVLREVASEKHNTRLEWIIILLIAVEVGFELRRVWREKREEWLLHDTNAMMVVEKAGTTRER